MNPKIILSKLRRHFYDYIRPIANNVVLIDYNRFYFPLTDGIGEVGYTFNLNYLNNGIIISKENIHRYANYLYEIFSHYIGNNTTIIYFWISCPPLLQEDLKSVDDMFGVVRPFDLKINNKNEYNCVDTFFYGHNGNNLVVLRKNFIRDNAAI